MYKIGKNIKIVIKFDCFWQKHAIVIQQLLHIVFGTSLKIIFVNFLAPTSYNMNK